MAIFAADRFVLDCVAGGCWMEACKECEAAGDNFGEKKMNVHNCLVIKNRNSTEQI